MVNKKTSQNSLSYALRYMFDNYGINIFIDSQKFIFTLNNLIPNLEKDLELVKFSMDNEVLSTLTNAYDKRDIDKNFAFLRAKTIFTKRNIPEEVAVYIIDSFQYGFKWIDEIPDSQVLDDFNISTISALSSINDKDSLESIDKNSSKNDLKKSSLNLEKVQSDNITTSSESTKIPKSKNNFIQDDLEPLHFEEKSLYSNKKDNKKYYLNHDFSDEVDDNDSNENEHGGLYNDSDSYDDYDGDDYDSYDEDYSRDWKGIFKKIALVLIPIVAFCMAGFLVFNFLGKKPVPVVSGLSITSEYKIESGNYVLPKGKPSDINVIIRSDNSKKIDPSKLSYRVDDPTFCSVKSDGKECIITSNNTGSTVLFVMYDNELIYKVTLYFKDFAEDEVNTENSDSSNEEKEEETPIENNDSSDEEDEDKVSKPSVDSNKNNDNDDNDSDSGKNNNSSNNNSGNSNNNSSNNNSSKPKPQKPQKPQKPEEPQKPQKPQKPEEPQKPQKPGGSDDNNDNENPGSNDDNNDNNNGGSGDNAGGDDNTSDDNDNSDSTTNNNTEDNTINLDDESQQ